MELFLASKTPFLAALFPTPTNPEKIHASVPLQMVTHRDIEIYFRGFLMSGMPMSDQR